MRLILYLRGQNESNLVYRPVNVFFSLRSKRFRGVRQQRNTEERDCRCFARAKNKTRAKKPEREGGVGQILETKSKRMIILVTPRTPYFTSYLLKSLGGKQKRKIRAKTDLSALVIAMGKVEDSVVVIQILNLRDSKIPFMLRLPNSFSSLRELRSLILKALASTTEQTLKS